MSQPNLIIPHRPLLRLLRALLLALVLCAVARVTAHAQQNAVPPIVITEIHYNPDNDAEWVEFVELYNAGTVPVDLHQWTLSGAVVFEFPPNMVLAPRTWLVVGENQAALHAKYGVTSAGIFAGHLDSDGERIELRDHRTALVDQVTYAPGFPWPTVGDPPGPSIQLVNSGLDNAQPGAWRSAPPTPGRANSVALDNPPPLIAAVSHSPQSPRSSAPVTVTVAVEDRDGVQSVRLGYQLVAPGDYIVISDPRYAAQWTWLNLTRAADGTWRVILPPSLNRHRHLVRYRIEATDRGGRVVAAPYPDDPQPNFAYFVYDGVPQWPASIAGGPEGMVTYDFAQMRPMAVYNVIARQGDVADALYMPNSPRGEGYMGDEFLWRGTLVYDGTVYDHVGFRSRGGVGRYATGKNMWKFDFLTGHYFQAYDDYGRPYATQWDNLNLSTLMMQTQRRRRGEQGMFESTAFRLFNLAGVPAANTNFAHLRVIDGPYEYGGLQYWGDFWGMYMAVEQPDGRFLKEHGLPDGNLYKMEIYGSDRNNLGRYGPADSSDVNTFMGTIRTLNPGPDWWRTNVDLEGYYSYRAVLEFVHHYDVDQGKNYLYYSNPETKKWSVLPWDVDLTWEERMAGTGVEPFLYPVLGRAQFNLEYQNRLRELRDLLLNHEQLFPMFEEHASWIDTPSWGLSMVDADRAMWDYHPIHTTRYIDNDRTRPGWYYRNSPDGTFRGMLELMRQYVITREVLIDSALLTDMDYPQTPVLTYTGAEWFPADQVRFAVGPYADPQGANTFAAMEWRIAEVTHPQAPAYKPDAPRLYEINATWESGEMAAYQRTLTPPPGVLEQGRAYRARVRMKDNTGRWSHWSAPVEFIATRPLSQPPSGLVISEIMYHPVRAGNVLDEDLEFVELHNDSSQPLPLGGMRISGGIDFRFPLDETLQPGAYVVLARDAEAFRKRYSFAPDAVYDRRLSNSGDTIIVKDPWGRTLLNVEYGDDSPWPAEADGDGYSLVYNSARGAPSNPVAWRRSAALHGSPGAAEPQLVVINEVRLSPNDQMAVELHNTGDLPAPVGRWFLGDSFADPRKVWLPANQVIEPGGYLVLDAALLRTVSFDGPLALNPVTQNQLVLSAGDNEGRLTGYQTGVLLGVAEPGASLGRTVDSQGRDLMVVQSTPTFGAANAGPRIGPVVISQVNYAPAGGPEFVELTNLSEEPVKLYDPAAPVQGWLLHGGYFSMPPGLEVPAHGRLLVTSLHPDEACSLFAPNGLSRIVGPMTLPLSDGGQRIALIQPAGAWDGAVIYATADALDYSAAAPWPAAGAGSGLALRRLDLGALGNDPANWEASNLPPGSGLPAAGTQLCSFGARSGEGGLLITWTLASLGEATGFRLWRNNVPTRGGAVEIAQQPATGQSPSGAVVLYSVTDAGADGSTPVYYWLDAETPEGVLDLGFTAPARPFEHVYLPTLSR